MEEILKGSAQAKKTCLFSVLISSYVLLRYEYEWKNKI